MQVDDTTLPEIYLYAFLFFVLYFLLYRKYIYSVVDPIFLYIAGLAFSSVLVINVLESEPVYIYHFFICHFFLFVGFSSIVNYLKRTRDTEKHLKLPVDFFDYYTVRLTVYILFFIYVLANIVLFYSTGFALLNDDPTLAKVENFSKGYGIILFINWGVGQFLLPAVIFFILYRPRAIDYTLLFFLIALTSLEGSKSALFRILIVLFLWVNHPLFKHKKQIVKWIKLSAPIGIFASLLVSFIVLSKENGSTEDAFFAFIKRLLYGADSILTFYLPVNEQYFSKFHFWEYPAHFFNQVLAFFRIVPNHEALGNIMVENAFPSRVGTIVGPNTPYYIEGQIYFGYYGAFIYSMLVGICYGLIREYFFNNKSSSVFWLIFTCCICQQAGALHAEVTFFFIQSFYSCFFVIPVYVVVSLAIHGRLKFRKVPS